MKNFEKYHDELLEHGRNFALVKNEAENCLDQYIDCDDCHFHGTFDCEITKWKWLFEDYQEPYTSKRAIEDVEELCRVCKAREEQFGCNKDLPCSTKERLIKFLRSLNDEIK